MVSRKLQFLKDLKDYLRERIVSQIKQWRGICANHSLAKYSLKAYSVGNTVDGPGMPVNLSARESFLSSKNVFPAKHSFYVVLPFPASRFLSIFSHDSLSVAHVFAFTWCLWSVGFFIGLASCTDPLKEIGVPVALQWHKPTAGIPTFRERLELVLGGPCSRVSVGFSLVTLWDRHSGCSLLAHVLVECTCVEGVNDRSHLWFSSRSPINCRSLILLSDVL